MEHERFHQPVFFFLARVVVSIIVALTAAYELPISGELPDLVVEVEIQDSLRDRNGLFLDEGEVELLVLCIVHALFEKVETILQHFGG